MFNFAQQRITYYYPIKPPFFLLNYSVHLQFFYFSFGKKTAGDHQENAKTAGGHWSTAVFLPHCRTNSVLIGEY